MPPWRSFVDLLDEPEAKSLCSTSATERPRLDASSATAAPMIPPPTTSTSHRSPSTSARNEPERDHVGVRDTFGRLVVAFGQ